MQILNCDLEIVIGNDASTDQTTKILEAYAIQFPKIIKIINHQKNVGASENLAAVILAAQGCYIALLEGDDYWTSPFKLQKQIDFLDSNENCVICHHLTEVVDDCGEKKGLILPTSKNRKSISNLEDLIRLDSFMATCSIMFRSKQFNRFPDIFFTLRNVCDWPLNVLNAEHGDIGLINENMASYRQATQNTMSSRPILQIMSDAIKLNLAFRDYLGKGYVEIFNKKIASYFYTRAIQELLNGSIAASLKDFIESLAYKRSPTIMIRFPLYDFPKNLIKGKIKNQYPSIFLVLKKYFSK